MADFVHEHVVTLKNFEDLEIFYQDMEDEGGALYIPNRRVEVTHKRPLSRNTNYMLTYAEAKQLRNDPRVEAVELTPDLLNYTPVEHGSYTQTSDAWDKSSSTSTAMKNWGLLRCTLPFNISSPSPWGSNTPTASPTQTATITVPASGKNVDVVIVDSIAYPNHPEFDARYVQYNWFQHNLEVTGGAPDTYLYDSYTGNNNHATHTSGTAAGNTQGWAREANIYNLRFSSAYTDVQYLVDYIRAFHRNKPINPETGRRNPTICNNSWGYAIANWVSTYLASITSVDYRGTNITPASLGNTPISRGQSGFFTESNRRVILQGNLNTGSRCTSNSTTGGVPSSIPFSLRGGAGLTSSTTPDVYDAVGGYDANDDGYWQLSIPFTIRYFAVDYTTIYVSTNGYITFGSGSYVTPTSGTTPTLPKIMINAADLSCQRIYYGVEGTSGTRTYTVRWEGTNGVTGTLGSPNIVWEAKFYEATPNVVDIQIGENAQYSPVFTGAQLTAYGAVSGTNLGMPVRVASLDADIADAIADGILFVTSAGNDSYKIDIPGGLDYDNAVTLSGNLVNYHRGSSPGAATGAICVGAIGTTGNEAKATYSNTGPRVDIYAPGSGIISSVYDVGINSGSGNYIKYDGTSMAAPQVTGVLACLLEVYPRMTQSEALAWLLKYAGTNQIAEVLGTGFTYTNFSWIQNGNNKFLYFKGPRESSGNVFPSLAYKPRPAAGMVYPRPNIYRSL
jgi:hypothetical protein